MKKLKLNKETINICFFDINGEYNESIVDESKNFFYLDSPIRILSQYITDNFVRNLSKSQTKDKYITKFTFSENIKNVFFTLNCDVICNFSVSHQDTFDSNGYIIFCDLEKNTTLKLLEKIINYIVDNCSIFIRTYIIGVFKDHIEKDKDYNKMKEFLNNLENDLEFEYYELFLGENKNFFEMKNKYQYCRTLDDVFKDIYLNIYKENGPNGKKFIEKDFGGDKSKICNIF